MQDEVTKDFSRPKLWSFFFWLFSVPWCGFFNLYHDCDWINWNDRIREVHSCQNYFCMAFQLKFWPRLLIPVKFTCQKESGVHIIDIDLISHEIMQKGTSYSYVSICYLRTLTMIHLGQGILTSRCCIRESNPARRWFYKSSVARRHYLQWRPRKAEAEFYLSQVYCNPNTQRSFVVPILWYLSLSCNPIFIAGVKYVVLDAPLLLQTPLRHICDEIIVVDAPSGKSEFLYAPSHYYRRFS